MPRKVAALIEGINLSHPLVDGNRRLSWICAGVFALRNGLTLAAPKKGDQ
jgi:death-on-curing protein